MARIAISAVVRMLTAQLREALAGAGYAVDVANNGTDADFVGQVEPFDAVVLDLGLPQMDGLTVLKRWRSAGRTMPVLILTARDAWHEKVAGIDADADDCIALGPSATGGLGMPYSLVASSNRQVAVADA